MSLTLMTICHRAAETQRQIPDEVVLPNLVIPLLERHRFRTLQGPYSTGILTYGRLRFWEFLPVGGNSGRR